MENHWAAFLDLRVSVGESTEVPSGPLKTST